MPIWKCKISITYSCYLYIISTSPNKLYLNSFIAGLIKYWWCIACATLAENLLWLLIFIIDLLLYHLLVWYRDIFRSKVEAHWEHSWKPIVAFQVYMLYFSSCPCFQLTLASFFKWSYILLFGHLCHSKPTNISWFVFHSMTKHLGPIWSLQEIQSDS